MTKLKYSSEWPTPTAKWWVAFGYDNRFDGKYLHESVTQSNVCNLHFASAVVAVVFSQLSASSSALVNDCNPPSDFVNRHLWTWIRGFLLSWA